MRNSIKYIFILALFNILLLGCSKKEEKDYQLQLSLLKTEARKLEARQANQEKNILKAKVRKLEARLANQEKNILKAKVRKLEARLVEARLANQEKNYLRNLSLVDKKFISENALDVIITEKNETIEELEIFKSRKNIAQSNIEKTKIYAPISGTVEKQIPSIGDFLKIGDPVFQIINNKKLRAHIPFPEKLARKLKSGIPIKLKTPTSESEIIVNIAELKPQLMSDSRSIDIIADIEGQLDWQPGASVKGTVIFSTREGVAVPEQSVVLRPAGQVVYIVNKDKVEQRKVIIGINQDGIIEILSGLEENEVVALDGAGYLTDQTLINISAP